jgi:hypothetical protein
VGTHPAPHHPPGTFKALSGNLGFSVYNLILTQVEEILGCHKKNEKK